MTDTGWRRSSEPLDPLGLFEALNRHQVRYVLVGGLAGVVHGWPGSTGDADIVPASDNANLGRLGHALHELDAVVWSDPDRQDLFPSGKPPEADDFGFTAEGLRRHPVWHLTSRVGLIDIVFRVAGVGTYDDLIGGARAEHVEGVGEVPVASLDDVIASKRAADRPKDRRVLPELEALRRRRSPTD